jgi:hypothetical protein
LTLYQPRCSSGVDFGLKGGCGSGTEFGGRDVSNDVVVVCRVGCGGQSECQVGEYLSGG